MPTSNKGFNLPIEPTEFRQWQEIAEEENLALTSFIRQAVREKIASMGYTPSSYEYKPGKQVKRGKKKKK